MKTTENAVISCLFYPFISNVIGRVQTVSGIKDVDTRKGRDVYTLQTGNLCYNAVSINYVLVLVYVQNCKRAKSPVCLACEQQTHFRSSLRPEMRLLFAGYRLSWSFEKGVCSLFAQKLRSAVHVNT